MRKIIGFVLLYIISFQSQSQILPKDGSRLNSRILGLSFLPEKKASGYKIEIAAGNYFSEDSFKKNIVQSIETPGTKVIAEVPAFDSRYTWRVVYISKSATLKNSPLYHFSTLTNAHVDTSRFHLRILHRADQYKDDYVAIDNPGVMYDMSGNPVWYIPDTNGYGGTVADLQFTKDGTVTFLYKNAFEINYNGAVLWKAPNNGEISGDPSNGEYYHHEFSKLSNGHYMVMGMQPVMCKPGYYKDSSYVIVANEADRENRYIGFMRGRFGTLIEYDEAGKVVWSWKSSQYLIGSDFDYYKGIDSNYRYDPHDNSFYFDEKNEVIYLGFRNLNRVIKIEYPSGKILRTYGRIFKPGASSVAEGLFCNQHSLGRTKDGDLYFFNNNSCGANDSLPTVVLVQEPVSANDDFRKVWEYTCTVEGDYPRKFGSGGNIVELPDRSLFVNMGTGYSKCFIVNREKKVLWSALPERFMMTDAKWTPLHEYRTTIISRKELEKLIWNAESE